MKNFLIKHHFLLSILSFLLFIAIDIPILLLVVGGWTTWEPLVTFIGLSGLMIFNVLYIGNKDKPVAKKFLIWIYVFVLYFLICTIVFPIIISNSNYSF
ncbi:MAG: hypothetical protein LBV55_02740 [Acholeplasmatales bacterium]|jgi:hypothetical protein|nr:hypothetical protein [Acholeplasmatales bacterium]